MLRRVSTCLRMIRTPAKIRSDDGRRTSALRAGPLLHPRIAPRRDPLVVLLSAPGKPAPGTPGPLSLVVMGEDMGIFIGKTGSLVRQINTIWETIKKSRLVNVKISVIKNRIAMLFI